MLYVAAVALRIVRPSTAARALWTVALAAYLVHVVRAFDAVHGWSHARAFADTARQTAELFGVSSGAGLWLNYLFTVVWCGDVAWWWAAPRGYVARPIGCTAAIHAFLAFLFFNATVVFGRGFSRWFGVSATIALIVLAVGRARAA